jgi:hypothetical protein
MAAADSHCTTSRFSMMRRGRAISPGGWERFFTDYGLERGGSLILTHRARSPILCVRVVDGSGCARAYFPWP